MWRTALNWGLGFRALGFSVQGLMSRVRDKQAWNLKRAVVASLPTTAQLEQSTPASYSSDDLRCNCLRLRSLGFMV